MPDETVAPLETRAERDVARGPQLDALGALVTDLADYAVLLLDAEGRVVTWNAGAERTTGWSAEQAIGRHLASFSPPEEVAAGLPQQLLREAGASGRTSCEGWQLCADGSRVWADVVLTALRDDRGGLRGYGVVARDLTERRAAQQALAASEALHRTMLERTDEAVALVDEQGCLTYANPALLRLLGATSEELLGHKAVGFLDQADREALTAEALTGRLPSGRREVELLTVQGERRVALLGLTTVGPDSVLALLTDVTAQRSSERLREHDQLHDALTGLPNRSLALDRLHRALHRRPDTTIDVAAVVVDVDGFQHVNHVAGREAGDGVLMTVAAALASVLTPDDTLARWGPDAFLVLREGVLDRSEARSLARRLVEAVADLSGDGPLPVTASAGVSLVGTADAETAVREAEAALLQARARGHGRIRVYHPSVAPEAFALPGELRRAVAQDELVVHYQPLVDLASGAVLKVEALVRWDHPRDGVLPPARFLPLVEAAGLTRALDTWVLERACRDLAGWGGPPLPVTVNVAPEQLLDPDAAGVVLDVLARTGLPPERLVLEMTEHALVEDVDAAVRTMTQLREAGVRIALDDFGTGFSGLSYLRTFPVDILKIDKTFTAGLDEPDARAIIASVLSLSRSIGLVTVAEGVETPEQQQGLLELGCAVGQGFLFSPGVPFALLGEVCARLAGGSLAALQAPASTRARRTLGAPAGLTAGQGDRIRALHGSGASLATIAARLNQEGHRRPDGVRWHAVSVARVLQGLLDQE